MESGFYRHMDKTILVTAPEDIRIERVIQRDKTTALLVSQRMKNQWNEERKIPLADFIILNDGKSPLIPAILDIHNKLIL
jgi:dephospho-CoA kinase